MIMKIEYKKHNPRSWESRRIEYNFCPPALHRLSGEREPKYETINNNLRMVLGWATREQKRLRGQWQRLSATPLSISPSLVRQLPLPLLAGTTATWNLDYISQHVLQLSVTKRCPMGWKQIWQMQLLGRILKGKEQYHTSSLPLSCLLALWHPSGIMRLDWEWRSLRAELQDEGSPNIWLCVAQFCSGLQSPFFYVKEK